MSKLAHSYQPTMDKLEMQRLGELHKDGEIDDEIYTEFRDYYFREYIMPKKDEKFVITQKEAAREPLYVRLKPQTIEKLNDLQKATGVNRADIIQQALEFALDRLEIAKQ